MYALIDNQFLLSLFTKDIETMYFLYQKPKFIFKYFSGWK